MTFEQYQAFCGGFAGSDTVVQWGGANVWKVLGKVFVMGRFQEGAPPAFTFKVTPMAYEILREQPGLRPAPYMASRGLTWIQHYEPPGLPDDELREQIAASYALVVRGLTKAKQRELEALRPS